jgi:hypothetical protein
VTALKAALDGSRVSTLKRLMFTVIIFTPFCRGVTGNLRGSPLGRVVSRKLAACFRSRCREQDQKGVEKVSVKQIAYFVLSRPNP